MIVFMVGTSLDQLPHPPRSGGCISGSVQVRGLLRSVRSVQVRAVLSEETNEIVKIGSRLVSARRKRTKKAAK
jgi:hypothetical protein